MKNIFKLKLGTWVLLLGTLNSYSQEIDTLTKNISPAIPVMSEAELHSPKKATIMSAVLPGLGQIYNRKYWKLPIIYGGLAGLVYSAGFADKRYKNYKEAYILRTDENPATIDKYDYQLDNGEMKYSENGLLELKEYYRRNRDLSYIILFGIYALNIIDANVDAHFFNFDISDDLSLNISGTAFPGNLTASLSLTLKL